MKIRLTAILALICALSASCNKPADRYLFEATPSHPADTFVFCFEMLMDNPAATYSTCFACRYKNLGFTTENIPLLVSVTSPTGEVFMENTIIPIASGSDKINRKTIGGTSDMEWPYRNRIRPGRDTGLWLVKVRPVDASLYEGILGMGFHYEEKI